MTAINNASSRTKLYGWIGPSLNFSTSSHLNLPEANDMYSNRFELNQLVIYAERLPDSVQRGHIDWGYHLTALYGTDYRFTFGKGYFSGQWLITIANMDSIRRLNISISIFRGFRERICAWALHLRSRHRGPARAQQLHLQPLIALFH
jgi:hypothetical protein